MQLDEAIQTRRAVKNYDADHRMPEAHFNQLIEAAILAPTSFNIQHWRFVRVKDTALRQAIQEAAWNQAQISAASELLLITADTNAWQRQPERYWRNASAEVQTMLVDSLTGFYQGREWLQRDEAIRSGAMAAQNIMLTARSLGYDTSPMIGCDIEKVGQLIDLPDDHVLIMLMAIGKGTVSAQPRGGQLSVQDVVIENRFA